MDPVEEVEVKVEQILREHFVLFGCDDPECAVASSNYIKPPAKPSRWKRLLAWAGLTPAPLAPLRKE